MALVASIIITLCLSYEDHTIKASMHETISTAFTQICGVIKRYYALLIPIGVLWAVSTAVGQKMLEIGIDVFNKVPKHSIIIIVISLIGAILGHVLSTFFTKQKRLLTMIFMMCFGFLTMYFPYILNKYDYYITLNISSLFMGIFFGISVNLLEGRLFYHLGEDHRKEYGSAAYGIIINIVIFLVMYFSDLLTHRIGMIIPFVFFGVLLLFMPLFIRRFK